MGQFLFVQSFDGVDMFVFFFYLNWKDQKEAMKLLSVSPSGLWENILKQKITSQPLFW